MAYGNTYCIHDTAAAAARAGAIAIKKYCFQRLVDDYIVRESIGLLHKVDCRVDMASSGLIQQADEQVVDALQRCLHAGPLPLISNHGRPHAP